MITAAVGVEFETSIPASAGRGAATDITVPRSQTIRTGRQCDSSHQDYRQEVQIA
jgi:hypothetical protein